MPYLGSTPNASFSSRTKQDFTANGSTTAFTLSSAVASANDIEVFVGNVRQEPTDAYTVNGTTLTMSEAPATGINFYVVFKQLEENSVVPADNTISTAKIVNNAVTVGKLATSGTLPALNGSALTSVVPEGPAFQANLASTWTIASNSATVIPFATEVYDTDSCYNNSNYRFTPNVAGYYMVQLQVRPIVVVSKQVAFQAAIQKNGAMYVGGQSDHNMGSNTDATFIPKTALIPMNGSSDYIDFTFYQYNYTTPASATVHANAAYTYAMAHLALKL